MRFTALEAAVGVALVGSVLAVGVPAFVRNLVLVAPSPSQSNGLAHIGERIDRERGKRQGVRRCLSGERSARTSVGAGVASPRSTPDPDPWQHPTWKALEFRPSASRRGALVFLSVRS